jgi:hypothetical protein
VELVDHEYEIAWAAGFFDGEGTTSYLKTKRDKYTYICMSVSQKDPTLLYKFQCIVGGYGKVYHNKRGISSWDCFRQEDVPKVLDKLWPYLSDIKRAQALKAKAHVSESRNKE